VPYNRQRLLKREGNGWRINWRDFIAYICLRGTVVRPNYRGTRRRRIRAENIWQSSGEIGRSHLHRGKCTPDILEISPSGRKPFLKDPDSSSLVIFSISRFRGRSETSLIKNASFRATIVDRIGVTTRRRSLQRRFQPRF